MVTEVGTRRRRILMTITGYLESVEDPDELEEYENTLFRDALLIETLTELRVLFTEE